MEALEGVAAKLCAHMGFGFGDANCVSFSGTGWGLILIISIFMTNYTLVQQNEMF